MNSLDEIVPLPEGWEIKYDPNSKRCYFLDHKNKITTWDDPRQKVIKSPEKHNKNENTNEIDLAIADFVSSKSTDLPSKGEKASKKKDKSKPAKKVYKEAMELKPKESSNEPQAVQDSKPSEGPSSITVNNKIEHQDLDSSSQNKPTVEGDNKPVIITKSSLAKGPDPNNLIPGIGCRRPTQYLADDHPFGPNPSLFSGPMDKRIMI